MYIMQITYFYNISKVFKSDGTIKVSLQRFTTTHQRVI